MSNSDDTRYLVEIAKTGQATCKGTGCKKKIAKGALRIVKLAPPKGGQDWELRHYYEVPCFPLPAAYRPRSNKTKTAAAAAAAAAEEAVETFVADILEDASGDILPERADEIRQGLLQALAAKKQSSGGGGYAAMIKEAYAAKQEAAQLEEDAGGDETKDVVQPAVAAKKQKTTHAATIDNDGAAPPTTAALIAYGRHYANKTNDQLKDVLATNKQVKTGTKDLLLAKCLDGSTYGRLARCAVCGGGKLKLEFQEAAAAAAAGQQDGESSSLWPKLTVHCLGNFDETSQVRIPCSYEAAPRDAPRWQPWYPDPELVTNEEDEAMDKLIEAAEKGTLLDDDNDVNDGGPTLAEKWTAAAKAQGVAWEPTSKAGLQQAVKGLAALLTKPHKDPTSDDDSKCLPALNLNAANDKEVRVKVGTLVQMHRNETLAEVMQALFDEYGTAQGEEKKQDRKKKAAENSVAVPANGGIVALLQELAELYFKESNRNAGATYMKAIAALRDIDFEITAANAKSLGAGKNKVAGIGKGTADKIYEYYTTGKIQKLEDKRAEAS